MRRGGTYMGTDILAHQLPINKYLAVGIARQAQKGIMCMYNVISRKPIISLRGTYPACACAAWRRYGIRTNKMA